MHVQQSMLPPDVIEDVLRRERQRSTLEPLRPRLELPLPLPPSEIKTSRREEPVTPQRGVVVLDLFG